MDLVLDLQRRHGEVIVETPDVIVDNIPDHVVLLQFRRELAGVHHVQLRNVDGLRHTAVDPVAPEGRLAEPMLLLNFDLPLR